MRLSPCSAGKQVIIILYEETTGWKVAMLITKAASKIYSPCRRFGWQTHNRCVIFISLCWNIILFFWIFAIYRESYSICSNLVLWIEVLMKGAQIKLYGMNEWWIRSWLTNRSIVIGRGSLWSTDTPRGYDSEFILHDQ